MAGLIVLLHEKNFVIARVSSPPLIIGGVIKKIGAGVKYFS